MAQQFSGTIAVTSDLTTVAYGFRPTFIRIDSATANTAYLSFNSTIAATTASSLGYPLTSGAPPILIDGHGRERNGMSSAFTAITVAGSTATIRVLAVRI